jgi:hypothetical protein
MKNPKVIRFAALLIIMLVLLACGMFTQPTPTIVPPTDIPPATAVPTQVKATEVPPTSVPTEIPPTPEPSTSIKIGPGKFGKPIWLEVTNGEYKLTSGDTLLTGSAIGVSDNMLTFDPGLSIEVAEGGVTLKGTDYAAGTMLVVDASGDIVEAGASVNNSANNNPQTATGNYLFQDDFSSNDKGWETGKVTSDYGEIDRQITNGQYIMTMMGKQDYYFAINSIPDVVANNFRISIDENILESNVSPGNLTLEISFREVDGVNGKHYSISLYNDGTYSGDVWPSADWKTIVNMWEKQASSDIKLDKGVKNTIVIEANGPVITLFVNGKKIDSFTDSTITEGGNLSINLGLDKPNENLKIAFDNITIEEIK